MNISLQEKTDPRIIDIIRRLQEANYEAYIVGGAVRDFLLEREPKDYDISTSATPEQVKHVFADKRCVIIGRRFRLVHLYLNRENIVEISTFRSNPDPDEQHLRDGVPEHMIFQDNEYGNAKDDANRRDFTVNSLFYDPVSDRILDYTGRGEADIQAHLVRSIGDPALRFEEDPVRMLRALKLVGQYGFSLEAETEKALRACMPMIVHASRSRLDLEFEKILRNPYGNVIIDAFRRYGLLHYFLPYLDERYDTPQGQYVMQLWAKRDERIRAGLYRNSVSMSLALIALPFIEQHFGNDPGGLWKPAFGLDGQLHDLILKVLEPRTIMRRINANAVSNLLMQIRFHRGEPGDHLFRSVAAYGNARELAAVQNEVLWKQEGFEENYPAAPNLGIAPRKRSRKRKHKKNSNAPADPGKGGKKS